MSTYLGQNFLKDNKVREFIANSIKELQTITNTKTLLEIGPGKGSLTKLICDISDNFFVIEKDNTILQSLKNNVPSLQDNQVFLEDVLDLDLQEFHNKTSTKSPDTLIVGNLPYYITSPIIRKFFGDGDTRYAGGIFMIQDEVAQKLQTQSDKKSFLRWLINYSYQVKYLKKVPPTAFDPQPKVNSGIIQITPKKKSVSIDYQKLLQFLDLYNSFSRKTLGKISKILEKKSQNIFKIPKELEKNRLEELGWEDIDRIVL